jgi:hypothetical protein
MFRGPTAEPGMKILTWSARQQFKPSDIIMTAELVIFSLSFLFPAYLWPNQNQQEWN